MTVDTIMTLLAKKYFFEVGTSERTKEEATYMLFIDFLHQCECGDIPDMRLSDVLSFFTGSRFLPPIGFDTQPALRFKSDAMYPLASTGVLQLTLPTMYHNDPTSFQDKVAFGMKNHGGFGLF